MQQYCQNQVVAKADVDKLHSDKKHYSMRTMRAFRATEWLKLALEYKVMEWDPAPPNPLAHKKSSTLIKHYAEIGCDDEWQARRRCYTKYGKNKDLR